MDLDHVGTSYKRFDPDDIDNHFPLHLCLPLSYRLRKLAEVCSAERGIIEYRLTNYYEKPQLLWQTPIIMTNPNDYDKPQLLWLPQLV